MLVCRISPAHAWRRVRIDVRLDHCIEHLRLSIMCHADTSLTSFKWVKMGERERAANGISENGNGKREEWHVTAEAKGLHRCVKWDPLMEWVRERAVPIFEDGVLEGPEMEEQ